jgi:integrase/recombinase XerD
VVGEASYRRRHVRWLRVIVHPVVMPGSASLSWTVLDDVGGVIEPVESYLAYLAALERSPNTQRAYATSLKLWFEFVDGRAVSWDAVRVDDVARFVAWLRAPADNVIVLEAGTARRSAATVNRHLSAVFGFYEHHARSGVKVASELVVWRHLGRGSYKPFLHHVSRGKPIATRPVKLRVAKRTPRTLSAEQLVTVLASPARARDRFLLALLAETGMRIGQALGLRHADFVSRAKEVRIVPRAENANGARAKLRSPATVPVTAGLVRCYSDYMHAEYGEIDSDYVFVNLWSGRIGSPMTYASVHQLVGRIRARTGVEFTPHMLRHTHATDLIRSGVAIEVVARLLTHQSSTTTSQIYVHLDAADVRAALQRAGVWAAGDGS